MSDFDHITPFRLVRTIAAAGRGHPAIYLLICEAAVAKLVEADLRVEIDVQLDAPATTEAISELRDKGLPPSGDGSVRLVHIDQWLPKLVDALDRHSPFLVQDGSQLLLLAGDEMAKRIIRRAPNLRNRLTDVFEIEPEYLSGG
ncbi:MAG: hypothetical protein ABSH32_34225 [Bryobacteraceae bacterium]|jgi:hypothetical protein